MDQRLVIQKLQRFGMAAAAFTAFIILEDSSVWAAQAFQEAAGKVTMDAEHYDQRVPRNSQDWAPKTTQAGFAGTGYMEAYPNSAITKNTGYVTGSPELAYNVQFTTTGTYYVWVRGAGPTGNDDSIHMGLDGAGPASADRISPFSTGWTWTQATLDAAPATLVVSTPGLHTVHIWMREDGVRVDKIHLRTSSSATPPSGMGPAESQRVTVNTDLIAPTGSMSINNGAAATNNLTVTLSLVANDNSGAVAQMQASNDGVSFMPAEPYSPIKPGWTLAGGDGDKKVYVKFADAAGNWSVPVNDTITLDETPPQLTITAPADGAIITGGTP